MVFFAGSIVNVFPKKIYFFREEEQRSREEMTRLREAIDKAKLAYEQDVEQQNMEIANLKDTLLEARRASKGLHDLFLLIFPPSFRKINFTNFFKGQERYTEQLEVVREEESTRSMMKREQDLGLFQFHEYLETFKNQQLLLHTIAPQ